MAMSKLEDASIDLSRSGLRRRDALVMRLGAGVARGPSWFAAWSDQPTDVATRGDRGLERGGPHQDAKASDRPSGPAPLHQM